MIYSKHLTDRLVINMVEVPVDQVRAELVLMDPQLGDVLLNAFVGATQNQVEGMAGRYMREIGRLIDDRPTVSTILVRNDALTTHIELAAERDRWNHISNPEPFDLLKVMVELEHEDGGPARTVETIMIDRESFSQNHDSATYAHGFNTRPIDPVYADMRERIKEEVTGVISQADMRRDARRVRSRRARRARRP